LAETKFCPACGYPESFATASCIRCGHQFPEGATGTSATVPELITDHSQPRAQSEHATQGEPMAQAVSMCLNHPAVQASARCSSCGADVCVTCDFVVPGPANSSGTLNIGLNTHLCPSCVTAKGAVRSMPGRPQQLLPLPGGVMCTHHPDVNAVRRCGLCAATMCSTCDFEFPGHFHLCPTCATNPQTALSPRRKKLIGLAYALAIVATLIIAVLFSGALADTGSSKTELEGLYNLIGILVFAATVGGVAVSLSAFDKRLGNPAILWGAVIWNGVLLALWVLLSIIGSLK
jgi:hypothetical protein